MNDASAYFTLKMQMSDTLALFSCILVKAEIISRILSLYKSSVGSKFVKITINSSDINVSGVSAGYFVTNDLEILAGTMFSQIDFEEGKKAILVSDSFVEDVFNGDNKKAIRN